MTRAALGRVPLPTKEEQIDLIMKGFNFKRVQRAMDSLKWEWHGQGIPSIDTLKTRAMQLLWDVCRPKVVSVRCGGFHAIRCNGLLRLEFCIEYMDGDE